VPFASPMSSQQADVESAFASPPGSLDAHPPTSPPRVDNGGPPATFAEPPSSAVVLDAKHVVADGDTLGLIGEMYQTPVRVIQRLNDLHPDSIIYPGETLRVPTQLQSTTHVVVPGETVVSIARRFDAPVDHVKALNGLAGDDVIHPGRELRVLRGTNAIIARREREQASEELSESDATAMMPTASTRPPREERDDERDAERDAELDAAPTRVPSRETRGSRGLSAVALFPARLLNATVDATLFIASELTSSLGWRLIRLPSGAETNQPRSRRDKKPSRVSARPGESLASVAARHGLRIRELQRANGITSDALDVGQSLCVTRLSFSERAPRLRRRTRRHLFERDAENDATRDVDRAWRRWRWRYEPRGEEAREFFSRRAGVGRSDSNVTERSDKVNEAIRASSSGERPRVSMTWEDRRPRRSSTKWHPKFAAPVKKTHDAFITSGFGWRWGRLHAGVDLAANEGTPILVSAGGTVAERVFDAGGYGWLLRVAHGDGWETRYAHCREIDKRLVVGKKVRRGQKVAEVGNTGRSFGPHLHFEVRRNGTPVDPLTCSDA
jgi:murein DD-endopeptidase MepM/ murein hydrolase activator NlpD